MKRTINNFYIKKRYYISLIVFLIILLVYGSKEYYEYSERTLRREQTEELKTIAELKLGEIIDWLKERKADAQVISQYECFEENYFEWLKENKRRELSNKSQDKLNTAIKEYGYAAISLCSSEGEIIINAGKRIKELGAETKYNIKEFIEQRGSAETGIYLCKNENKIHLDIFIRLSEGRLRKQGIIIFRIDPATYLFPTIQKWPVPSESGETYLVKKENDGVIYLSELKKIKESGFMLKPPFKYNTAATEAVRGRTRIFEGKDYGGSKVIAYISKVLGTNWFLISKLDKDEMFKELNFREKIIIVIGIGYIIFVIVLFLGLLFYQQKISYREMYRKEKELNLIRKRYLAILEAIPDIIMEVDKKKKYTWANKAGIEFFGGEVIGKDAANYFVGEQDTYEVVEPLFEGTKDLIRVESWQRRQDGEKRLLAWQCRALDSDDGKGMGAISTAKDITERKIIEEELIVKNLVFESSLAAQSIADNEGRIKNINEAFLNMWSYNNSSEIEGKNVADFFINNNEAEKVINILDRDGKWEGEFAGKKKDGTEFICKGYATILKDKNGNKIGYQSTNLDITFLRKAQKELEESEEKFKYIFDNSVIGKSITYPGGAINVNKAFAEMLGYTKTELQNKRWQEISFSDDITKTQNEVDSLITGEKKSARFIKRYIKKDNSIMWADVSTSLRRDDLGNPLYFMTSILDITERKLFEEQILDKEKRFRTLSESLPLLVWTSQADGMCDYFSPQWIEYTGISEEEQLGNGWLNQVQTEDRERAINAWKNSIKKGSLFDIEFRIKGRDDVYRWFKTRAIPIKDHRGKITKWFGANIDIDDLKKAHEELKKHRYHLEDLVKERSAELISAKERLRFLVSATPAVIYSSKTSGDFGATYISENVKQMVGYESKDFTENPEFWAEHIHPDDRVKVSEGLSHVFEKDKHMHEYRFLHKDGTYRWMHDELRLIRDEKGEPLELIGYWTDITEQKNIEKELQLGGEIFANMSEGVYLIRTCDGIIVFANRQFEILFGYEPGEIIGRHVSAVNAPTDKSPGETAKEIMSALKKNGVWNGEVYNIRKDGTPFLCFASVTEFEHPEFGKVWLSVHKDITDRKLAELEIEKLNIDLTRRAQELEAANKELESFSYSVSHDLRAPLRAIGGYTKILTEDYLNAFDNEGKRLLSVIIKSTKDMGQLIDDLLAFSRISRQEIKKVKIDVGEILRTVVEELSVEVEKKNIHVNIDNLPECYGDLQMIKQVWRNLVGNAIKFSKKNEKAEIQIGSDNGSDPTYYIKDNGVGFENKYSDKLFEVFHRLHNTKEFEGTGVGLAIVKRIIDKHGGRVWAKGEVNKGAIFFFTLK